MRFLAEVEIRGIDNLEEDQIVALLGNCQIELKNVRVNTYKTDNSILRELCKEYKVDDWKSVPIDALVEKEMLSSAKGYMALQLSGIKTLGDLTEMTRKQFLTLRNIGKITLENFEKTLGVLGLSFK